MNAHPCSGRRRLVWLASYPKSGNTWTRVLLANFLSTSDGAVSINRIGDGLPSVMPSSRGQFDELAGIPSSDCTDDEADGLRPGVYRAHAAHAEQDGTRLFVKVHDAFHDTPAGEPVFPEDVTVGAIYLLRNPLDVAVSWTFHVGRTDVARGVARVNDPEAALGGYGSLQMRQRLFDWSRHVESWLGAPFPVLRVRYEDLLADTAGQLARMARFLALDGAADERRLRRAVAFADFTRLRKNEETEGFRERAPATRRFFRSGKAGDWRRYLTAVQVRGVVETHRRVMAAHGYDPHAVLREIEKESEGNDIQDGPENGFSSSCPSVPPTPSGPLRHSRASGNPADGDLLPPGRSPSSPRHPYSSPQRPYSSPRRKPGPRGKVSSGFRLSPE